MKKRAAGEGTIRQLPSGSWFARATVNGVRKSFTAPTQRKAREWLTAVRRELDLETYVDPSDMPFHSWWDRWIDTYKKDSVKPATLATYAASRARLTDELMRLPLNQITRSDVQSEINAVSQAGKSRRTVELTLLHVKMCLDCAVTDRMLRFNPAVRIELPPKESTCGELHLLTDDEYNALIRHCTDPSPRKNSQPYKDCLLTILYTGLRRAEAINLKWSDWSGDVLQVSGTKTKNAKRRILLDPDVIDIFERRKKTTRSFYIFETSTGSPLTARNLFRHIQALNGHNVHDLRHTFATRAIQAGVDAKTLSEILGHADVSTTMRLYVHPTDDSKRDAVSRMKSARARQGNEPAKVINIQN
ncbi:MAG: integrase [Oscillospiraceae bacterium]|nr:integrase [Oscillospiraceae bacterium]